MARYAPTVGTMSQWQSCDQAIADLVADLARRLQAGEAISLETFIAEHAEHEERLRRLLPAMQVLAGFGSSAALEAATVSPAADQGASATHCGTLGDFRIIREIGRGGMGIVYEAEQMSLNRRVALKVLPFAAMFDVKQLQRFKNEAQAAAQLHHTNIVPVHFVGSERGVHYYAMQFIEGHTLAQVIQQLQAERGEGSSELSVGSSVHCQVPPPGDNSLLPTASLNALSTQRSACPRELYRTVAQLGMQAAEALDHAHQVGIIHRDIKPSNLLLDLRGNLWITDFGLARLQSDSNLTMTGDLIGTLRYMSPEQALAKRVVVDHRTDIYSLGVTLYELLTLQPVFSDHDRQEILRQIAFDEPEPPRKLNPSIPEELETIVLKAMSKNPSERYATAQEFAEDLRRYLDDKTILARRPGAVRRLVKWSVRHKPLVGSMCAATAAAIVVLAISIGWVMSDRDWRQNETEREVKQTIAEAEQHMSGANWLAVKTTLGRADGLLVTGRANDELRERVHQLHMDVDMIALLGQIREDDLVMLDGLHDYDVLDKRYDEAFRDYGMNVLDGRSSSRHSNDSAQELEFRRIEPSHAVVELGLRPRTLEPSHTKLASQPLRQELAAALDHWAVVRRRATGVTESRILAVARVVDPDELRNRIRDALERNELDALPDASSSAALAKLPPASAILLAGVLAETGDAARAVTVLETAQQANPGDLWINLVLAQNLHKLSRWDEMRRFAEIAHALRPSSGAAHLAFADALRHKGSLDQSAAMCQEVIQLEPDNPHAYELLGSIREDQTEWSDAVTQFRRAIELDPNYVEARNHLGRCLTRKGEINDAIEQLGIAIEQKPHYGGAHQNLGIALWRKGRTAEAIEELQKAVELDTSTPAQVEKPRLAGIRVNYPSEEAVRSTFPTTARRATQIPAGGR